MRHLMLDLETFGLQRGNAARSIGAVPFDPTTGIVSNAGQSFYQNIDWYSQAAVGLTKDENTVKWWSDPSLAEARALLEIDPVSVHAALQYFDRWLRYTYGEEKDQPTSDAVNDVRLWSRGTMDWEVLEGVYKACERPWPFHYRMQRDSRPFLDLVAYDEEFFKPEFMGTPHYALDDAKYEAHCVNAVFEHRLLNVPRSRLAIVSEDILNEGVGASQKFVPTELEKTVLMMDRLDNGTE